MLAVLFIMAPHPQAEELLRVNVFPGPQYHALYVAQDKGLFAKRGLTVEIKFTPNSLLKNLEIDALLSSERPGFW